jgi:hypothetical protein
MSQFNPKQILNENGVSMIQFALAFPVFMLFVLVIIDLGRITALSNVVRESMAIGLQQATSVANLDVDPRGLDTSSDDYERLVIARDIVGAGALRLIDGLGMIATGTDAAHAASTGPKLFDLTFSEDRITDGPDTKTFKVAILMPGECVDVPSIGRRECNRDTLGLSATDPAPEQAPEILIRKHPLKLVAFASFDAYTPWLFNRWQKFEQYGYRQPIPRGPFKVGVDPATAVQMQAEMVADDEDPLGAADRLPEPLPSPLIPAWNEAYRQAQGTPDTPWCVCVGEPDDVYPLNTKVDPDCCVIPN